MGMEPGLAASGDLDRIEVISSVSGGSYASSWYFVQNAAARKMGRSFDLSRLMEGAGGPEAAQPESIERPCTCGERCEVSPELAQLKSNSHLMTWRDIAGAFAGNLIYLPGTLLLNGVFGWHANTSYGHRYYRRNLKRTFFTPPCAPAQDPTLHELATAALEQKLPLFIFNATVLIEDSKFHYAGSMAKSVFEFTPLWFGSDAFGRWKYADDKDKPPGYTDVPEIPVSLAISISGAAYDTEATVSGPSQTLFSTAANMDLGHYFPNPAIPGSERERKRGDPFPFYFFERYIRDAKGIHVYLTDGGHSENLGLFSLVRRGCENIIVVDGEALTWYGARAPEGLLKIAHSVRSIAG